MISKINITEFRERLHKNTKIGNPKIKGTPFAVLTIFGESEKPFLEHSIKLNLNLLKTQLYSQHLSPFQEKLTQK